MVTNTDQDIIREFADRGALLLLESPVNMREFIRLLSGDLADHLDFMRAERINRSLVPADLHKLEADLIYRVPFQAEGRDVLVYLLLEHQSKVDRFIGQRLHSYMGELWEAQRRAWKDNRTPQRERWLSPIVPIVFYTGKKQWKHPLTLDAAMDLPIELSGFVPRHETLCLNLPGMPSDALSGSAIALVLRVIQAEDIPPEEFAPLFTSVVASLETLPPEQQAEWQRALFYLVLLIQHRRSAQEYDKLISIVQESVSRQHQEEVAHMVYSAAQAFRAEGRLKGREEGLEEGLEKGRAETLLEQLDYRFGPLPAQVASAIRALPPKRLQEITRQILLVQSLDELHLSLP